MNKTKRINKNKTKTKNKTKLVKSKQKGGVRVHYDKWGPWHKNLYPCGFHDGDCVPNIFYSLGYTDWDTTIFLAGWAEGWGIGTRQTGITAKQSLYMLNLAYPRRKLKYMNVNQKSDLNVLPVGQASPALSFDNGADGHIFIIIRTDDESYTVFDPQGGWEMSLEEYCDWNWNEGWHDIYEGNNFQILCSNGDALTNGEYHQVTVEIINQAMAVYEFQGGAATDMEIDDMNHDGILKSYTADEMNVETKLIKRKWGRNEEKNHFPKDPEYSAIHTAALDHLHSMSLGATQDHKDSLRYQFIKFMEHHNIKASAKRYHITYAQAELEVEDHTKSLYSIINSIHNNCFPLVIDLYKVFKASGIPLGEYEIAAVQLCRILVSATLKECKELNEQQFLELVQRVKELPKDTISVQITPRELTNLHNIRRGTCMNIK